MLKATAPIRVPLLFASLLLCSAFALAQDDWHVSDDGAKAFFLRSAFAHGYMHGYEEGFHHGDLDLQMGRPFRQVKAQEKFKKICGYRAEFGDRGYFEDGYRKGYAVGYIDSYGGRNFRAMQLVEQAKSVDLSETPVDRTDRLDRAFIAGYESGQKIGLRDGRAAAAVAAVDSIDCSVIAAKDSVPNKGFCGAYQGGYRLGYSDGYTNQREGGEVFARK